MSLEAAPVAGAGTKKKSRKKQAASSRPTVVDIDSLPVVSSESLAERPDDVASLLSVLSAGGSTADEDAIDSTGAENPEPDAPDSVEASPAAEAPLSSLHISAPASVRPPGSSPGLGSSLPVSSSISTSASFEPVVPATAEPSASISAATQSPSASPTPTVTVAGFAPALLSGARSLLSPWTTGGAAAGDGPAPGTPVTPVAPTSSGSGSGSGPGSATTPSRPVPVMAAAAAAAASSPFGALFSSSPSSATLDPEDTPAARQFAKTQEHIRTGMVAALREAMKLLIVHVSHGDASDDSLIDTELALHDEFEPLDRVTMIVDHMLQHGLRERRSLLSSFLGAPAAASSGSQLSLLRPTPVGHETAHVQMAAATGTFYWDTVIAGVLAKKDASVARSIDPIRDLAESGLLTPRLRGRAWVKIALMEKRLSDYLAELASDHETLANFYAPHALLRASGGDTFAYEVVGLLQGLDTFDISADIRALLDKETDQEGGSDRGILPTCYANYLYPNPLPHTQSPRALAGAVPVPALEAKEGADAAPEAETPVDSMPAAGTNDTSDASSAAASAGSAAAAAESAAASANAAARRQHESLASQKTFLELQLKMLQSKHEAVLSQLKATEQQIIQLQTAQTTLKGQLDTQTETNAQLQGQLESLRQNIAEERAHAQKVKQDLNELYQAEIRTRQQLEKTVADLQGSLAQLNAHVEKLQADHKQRIIEYDQEICNSNRANVEISARAADLEVSVGTLTAENETLSRDLAKEKTRTRSLQAERAHWPALAESLGALVQTLNAAGQCPKTSATSPQQQAAPATDTDNPDSPVAAGPGGESDDEEGNRPASQATLTQASRSSRRGLPTSALVAKSRDQVQTHISTLQTALEDRTTALVRSAETNRTLERRVLALEGELSSAGRQAIADEAALSAAKSETTLLQERLAEMEAQLAKARSDLEASAQAMAMTMQTNQELTSQNMALQVEVGRLDDKVKTLSGEWRCDTTATECGQCKTEFSFLKSRKHHCRRCGGIFCSRCTKNKAKLPAYPGPERVCDDCYDCLINQRSQLAN
ncbi:hypothetical protein H696_02836 [Fonticula alba]|uniref:FYVE-type domain-containing protein n=1 Tax=Fonticula alba TaxID=691883 RepID=A0A058Z8D6_FONAL|nr:hypothetical protein H696_02836 [Fonticula alba]KCV70495.1 hypothetical protein H696_02836 [Fonticula alba]|eukprot:XP_009495011.1 hypothetical protein H696_02836 [Fonticula alba]